MFLLLKKKIKSKEDYKVFESALLAVIKNNSAISDNPILDGFIIGLIYSNSKYVVNMLLTQDQLPPLSDHTIQQLEHCLLWLHNNEKKLITIF